MTLRPATRLSIDDYRFDPAAPSLNRQNLSVDQGGFRAATGAVADTNREGYRVASPLGVVGVRGTNYEAVLTPSNNLVLGAYEGTIDVTSPTGNVAVLGEGADFNFARVDSSGGVEYLLEPPEELASSAGVTDDQEEAEESEEEAEESEESEEAEESEEDSESAEEEGEGGGGEEEAEEGEAAEEESADDAEDSEAEDSSAEGSEEAAAEESDEGAGRERELKRAAPKRVGPKRVALRRQKLKPMAVVIRMAPLSPQIVGMARLRRPRPLIALEIARLNRRVRPLRAIALTQSLPGQPRPRKRLWLLQRTAPQARQRPPALMPLRPRALRRLPLQPRHPKPALAVMWADWIRGCLRQLKPRQQLRRLQHPLLRRRPLMLPRSPAPPLIRLVVEPCRRIKTSPIKPALSRI